MRTDQIIKEADRCVRCAYCLPYCPTYRLAEDEADSPRGRIAMIRALADGELSGDDVSRHLDRCLSCRACERVCPSRVSYESLISAARTLQHQGQVGWRQRFNDVIRWLFAELPYYSPFVSMARLLQRPFRGLVGKLSSRLAGLMIKPVGRAAWQERYLPSVPNGLRVGLFSGCISRLADASTIDASIRVLNQLGYEVVVPRGQGCCGAMDRHAGDSGREARLMARNHAAFDGLALEAVVFIASGCGARLSGYSTPLSVPVMDISRFVVEAEGFRQLSLSAQAGRVVLHTPCTLKNVLGHEHAAMQLVEQIPGIDLQVLKDNGHCCGGAGLFILTQPELSDSLSNDKVEKIVEQHAEILLTSNTGCAMQLRSGLQRAGCEVRVMHPVELLAEQLNVDVNPL